eukprot:CAMPEP_0198144556 /NCGR_PEP_ID=MMETSP1443-20131203/16433_1 /TAXON_ID=186043 /ORGANISM="Entomoneis sp., Strain CCMP2396" /LENGTH=221 /DNA_ID=CAMNT_0043807963 /DNA_START=71 /DNA_END=736 /DNA_ORIENTATION=+
MKFLSVLALITAVSNAFVLQPSFQSSRGVSSLHMAVDLVAEPEGGIELSPVSSSMPGCRVKQMDELQGVKCDFGTPYEFWMTAEVDGALVKEVHTQISKDASKKAAFPGFRKGQVPPYAQPQITQFSVQESLIKTVRAILDGYGLKELAGDDGKVEVKEDVADMCKGYKVGGSLKFTATLNGSYDPEKQPTVVESESEVETEAIEAVAVVESESEVETEAA